MKKVLVLLEDSKLLSEVIKINNENTAQKAPAKATVVNFGVSFLHLSVTETEKPKADIIPNKRPNKDPFSIIS